MHNRNRPFSCTFLGNLTGKRRLAYFLFFTLGFLLFSSGCERPNNAPQPVIRLDHLAPLPALLPEPDDDALRVAVAAIMSPQGTVESYQSLITYLQNKTGKNVILIQRKTYQETNKLLERNMVDVAFVCTGAYMSGKKDMELLVIPQIDGKTTYRSLLIVSSSSPVTDLTDLRGSVFAFTDPLSNSGYLYPLSLLHSLGEKPESFFARTIFTYSHDRSIRAVMEGLADGAAVDSIVYDFFTRRADHATKTKIIWQSSDFGMPPVVVPKSTNPLRQEELKALFLGIGQDSEGHKVLAEMGIDRFVPAHDDLYE